MLVAILLGGCATSTRQTDRLQKHHETLPERSRIAQLQLIKQADNHCGPATLAMVLQHAGKKISLKEITSQSFTAKAQGTFQADMLSTVRHQGMLTLPVRDLDSLVKEVSAGNPVIVFQNLGFSWWPQWHYAVVSGHDFTGPDIYLHTGDKKFAKFDMRFFERSWKLGGFWGIVVMRPDQLSASGSELEHAEAAALLEQINKLTEAHTAFVSILKRWPQSLAALIGLGNIAYANNQFQQAVVYLEQGVRHHPLSAIAWHNLALAQGAAGKRELAKKSALKSIELTNETNRATFQHSLRSWL